MSALQDAISAAHSRACAYRAAAASSISRSSGNPQNTVLRGNQGGGIGSFNHVARELEQYRAFKDWVYVAIRPICTRIAGQPIHVGKRPKRTGAATGSANKPNSNNSTADRAELARNRLALKSSLPGSMKSFFEDIEPIQNHAVLNLLDDPNPLYSGWALRFLTVASLEITGKSIWWIGETGESKNDIYYLPSHWCEPLWAQQVWKIQPPNWAKPEFVPFSNIAYFYYPDPADPANAYSPLQSAAKAISTDEQIQTSQYMAFRNGIRPSVIIKAGRLPNKGVSGVIGGPEGTRPVLTPDQRNQLVTAIQLAYEGVGKHGVPAIVDGLIDEIIPFTNKPSEMDWLASGESTKQRIMQAFGVNHIIAGQTEGANRASAVVADQTFISNVVNPAIELLSQEMTRTLGTLVSTDREQLAIWIEEARARDHEMELREWELAMDADVATGNEFRERVLNLPPRPELEQFKFQRTAEREDEVRTQEQAHEQQQSQQAAEQQRIESETASGEDESELSSIDRDRNRRNNRRRRRQQRRGKK